MRPEVRFNSLWEVRLSYKKKSVVYFLVLVQLLDHVLDWFLRKHQSDLIDLLFS